MTQLNESGLAHNDLDNLILPLLEIDSFESKIDDARSIVVAFYLFEQEPAQDLDNFISKSNLEIFDSEASPAPTTDGYYVVFVEIERNNDFPKTVIDLISEINNLTSIDQWRFKAHGQQGVFDLTEENLRDKVNLDPEKVGQSSRDAEDKIDLAANIDVKSDEKDEKSLAEHAMPFLIDSLAESIHCENDFVTLNLPNISKKYKVLAVYNNEPNLPILMPAINDPILTESLKLSAILGNTYNINVVNDGILVDNNQGYIILEPLD